MKFRLGAILCIHYLFICSVFALELWNNNLISEELTTKNPVTKSSVNQTSFTRRNTEMSCPLKCQFASVQAFYIKDSIMKIGILKEGQKMYGKNGTLQSSDILFKVNPDMNCYVKIKTEWALYETSTSLIDQNCKNISLLRE